MENKLTPIVVISGLLAAIIGLPLGFSLAKGYARITYAHGLTYFGPENKTTSLTQTDTPKTNSKGNPIGWVPATGIEKGDYLVLSGKIFPFQITVNKNLGVMRFPNDQSDAIGIKTDTKTANENLLLIVEDMTKYDKAFSGKIDLFVQKYWTYYSGLSGIKEISDFTNNGVTGFKALYQVKGSDNFTTNVFVGLPGKEDYVVHLIKGDLSNKDFSDIVNSFTIKEE